MDQIAGNNSGNQNPRRRRSVPIRLEVDDGPSYNQVIVNGVKVLFPPRVVPYDTQTKMMETILESLTNSQNALIESPTGSGKTMGLLAPAIAWLDAKKKENGCECKRYDENDENDSSSPTEESSPKKIKIEKSEVKVVEVKVKDIKVEVKCEPSSSTNVDSPPLSEDQPTQPDEDFEGCTCDLRVKIYYASRTHKQLSQVIKEYSRLPYAKSRQIQHTVLGSRKQTCINDEVRFTDDINSGCQKLRNPTKKKEEEENEEDIKRCTYYHNVSQYHESPIRLRTEMRKQAIDDAWGLELLTEKLKHFRLELCPYYATRTLTKNADITFCVFNYIIDPKVRRLSRIDLRNAIVILDEAHNIEDACRDAVSFSFTDNEVINVEEDLRRCTFMVEERLGTEENNHLKSCLEELLDQLEKVNNHFSHFLERCRDFVNEVKGNRTLFDKPAVSNLSPEETFEKFKRLTENRYKEKLEAFHDSLEGEKKRYDKDDPFYKLFPTSKTLSCLNKLRFLLEYYCENHSYYVSNVTIETDVIIVMATDRLETYNRDGSSDKNYKATINFWCMMPSVCAKEAFDDCRSVILASGTLHPMTSFASELGLEFRNTMSGEQLIPKGQIFAAGIPWGPTSHGLKFSKSAMDLDQKIKPELTRLILDVCKVVPNGVLVFVSSYRMLDDLENIMNENGLMKELKEIKEVFTEPQDTTTMNELLESFEKAATTPQNGKTGALMIAVYRGKVAEGIDFADKKARCVISVGIPFPMLLDPKIVQKKTFNCKMKKEIPDLLNGGQWYSLQAFRALNQALGRCLRHRKDWGALLLVDKRHRSGDPMISKWVRDRMVDHQHNNYQNFRNALVKFVAGHNQTT